MIQGIRHIIFDLGGVLLNLDYSATEKAFVALGISNFNERYSQLKQTSLFNDLETGRINRAEFIKAIQDLAPHLSLTEAQIIKAWNAMLLDFPLRRLQILQQLRLYYDLVLLSNTNEIHEEAFNGILMNTHSIPAMGAFFDRIYLSHRIGMRKPDKEVFERILEENEFKPEHTLFIDDSPQHIATAKSLGIQTIHLTDGMTIEKDIFLPQITLQVMTDAQSMMAQVAALVQERLGALNPVAGGGNRFTHPDYLLLREAINDTETELRKLMTGDDVETHEWLAVIHYALADERARLLA